MSDVAFETRCIPSLSKVFADEELKAAPYAAGTALVDEYFSYQVAYRSKVLMKKATVSVQSGFGDRLSIRSVGLAPSELPNYDDHDDYLLRTTPGLYPDPLLPIGGGSIHALPNQWRSLWITVHVTDQTEAGIHPITVQFKDDSGNTLGSESFRLEVIRAKLPEQKLIRTEWFYLDCLADWYDAEVFSEDHWRVIEAYLSNYVEHGMNMILTPLFTPPLEMEVGGDRPTVQLVQVSRKGDRYAFDFSRLERWIALCRRKGIRYFEFSHLFTQWGAKHAPKIVATEDGAERRIFGWETDAAGAEYRQFLAQFVPELVALVRAYRLEGQCYFHISDEPYMADFEHYAYASKLLRSLAGDFPILDALSDFEFYSTGLVTHPVVATDFLEPFLASNAGNLWAYYCCGQYKEVSNRFFNMPSSRTRVIGVQMYKHGIQGFLHWGYNHWYSQKSLRQINPYEVTDADHGFPSGDAFLVYPGKDGPVSSLRMVVLREAMQDMRALSLLEELAGQEEALRVMEEGTSQPLTFSHYERDDRWLLDMRERVNRAIQERLERNGVPC